MSSSQQTFISAEFLYEFSNFSCQRCHQCHQQNWDEKKFDTHTFFWCHQYHQCHQQKNPGKGRFPGTKRSCHQVSKLWFHQFFFCIFSNFSCHWCHQCRQQNGDEKKIMHLYIFWCHWCHREKKSRKRKKTWNWTVLSSSQQILISPEFLCKFSNFSCHQCLQCHQ